MFLLNLIKELRVLTYRLRACTIYKKEMEKTMDYYQTKFLVRSIVQEIEDKQKRKYHRILKVVFLILVVSLVFNFFKITPKISAKDGGTIGEMLETSIASGKLVRQEDLPKEPLPVKEPPTIIASFSPMMTPYKIPWKVRVALDRSAETILRYEIANGNLSDQEVVLAAYTRRLMKMNNTYPKASIGELIDKVCRGWNPNMDKDFASIKKRASKTKIKNVSAIENAKLANYKTKAGKRAWKDKITDFAHMAGKKPSYYKKLDSWVYTPKNTDVKTVVACASNPSWVS